MHTITQRLRTNLEALNEGEDRRYTLSLSVGELWCDPADPRSLNELLGRADAMMYERKQKRSKAQKT